MPQCFNACWVVTIKCPWAGKTPLFGTPGSLFKNYRKSREAARTTHGPVSITASSSLKLSLLYRFGFLRGGWGAPFIWNGFYFIAMMTPSPSSKWKNQSRSVKRIASLLPTHPMSPSLGTAAEGLFPKCLFLDSSLHSSSFDFVYWKKKKKTAASSLSFLILLFLQSEICFPSYFFSGSCLHFSFLLRSGWHMHVYSFTSYYTGQPSWPVTSACCRSQERVVGISVITGQRAKRGKPDSSFSSPHILICQRESCLQRSGQPTRRYARCAKWLQQWVFLWVQCNGFVCFMRVRLETSVRYSLERKHQCFLQEDWRK